MTTGIASVINGDAVFSDGDGKDFEGVDMPDADEVLSVLVVADSTNTGTVVVDAGIAPAIKGTLAAGGVLLTTQDISSEDLVVIFSTGGDSATLVVAAKTA